MKQSNNGLSYLLIAIAGTCWGLTGACNRFLTAFGLAQIQIMFVRVGVALVLMMLYLCIFDRSAFRIKIKDIWIFLGSGIASLALFGVSYFYAMQLMSLSAAAVLLYMAPIFVVLLSSLFFKECITLQKIVALVLIVAGAACTTGLIGSAIQLSGKGLMFGLLSAIGYALYSIFSRFALQRGYSSNTITFYTFLFCTVAVGIPAGFVDTVQLVVSSSDSLVWSLVIGVVTCLLPYMFYTQGLRGVENGRASIVASIELIVATLVSVLFFHETFLLVNFIGIVLVFAGIICVNVNLGKEVKNG